jgi:hypothetical protein
MKFDGVEVGADVGVEVGASVAVVMVMEAKLNGIRESWNAQTNAVARIMTE